MNKLRKEKVRNKKKHQAIIEQRKANRWQERIDRDNVAIMRAVDDVVRSVVTRTNMSEHAARLWLRDFIKCNVLAHVTQAVQAESEPQTTQAVSIARPASQTKEPGENIATEFAEETPVGFNRKAWGGTSG